MKNFRLVLFTACLAVCHLAVFADNNPSTNNSATQMKTGNRNASVGAEAAFYNPAGTVFGAKGFTAEFSLIPFASSQSVYDEELDKTYTSETSSLFYPALNLTYAKDKFVVFSNIGITNGGGAGDYKEGLPQFERLGFYTMYSAILAGAVGLPSSNPYDYTYQSQFEGSAYGIGGSLGLSYKFTDWLSAAVAVQYSSQTNHQEGSLLVNYDPAGATLSQTDIDVDYTGSNMGFIFGLNVKPTEKLMIAQTFRYYTELELTTEVNDGKDGGGLFTDGEKMLSTYVPYYSLGISYFVSEKLRIEADMNVSFYSMLDLDTDMEGNDYADYYNNGVDYGLCAEYQFTDKLNWGVGFTYAPSKMKEEYMSEMEFEMNSIWLNTGVTYSATDKLQMNLAFQTGITTEDVSITYDSALNPGTTYDQKYSKDPSFSLGLGVSYTF